MSDQQICDYVAAVHCDQIGFVQTNPQVIAHQKRHNTIVDHWQHVFAVITIEDVALSVKGAVCIAE